MAACINNTLDSVDICVSGSGYNPGDWSSGKGVEDVIAKIDL